MPRQVSHGLGLGPGLGLALAALWASFGVQAQPQRDEWVWSGPPGGTSSGANNGSTSGANSAASGGPFVLRTLGRCLEVNEPQLRVNGARVQLQACDGKTSQTWRRQRGQIVNLANGLCLDVHGPDTGFNGARVQTVTCSAAPNQQWRYERGQLVVRVDERCLDAQAIADPRQPLVQVQTWDCQGHAVQRWRVLPLVAALPSLPSSFPPPAPNPQQAARTRDVEAGPLFNNAEAARKCPAVCAATRWSGQWLTTVPGRMSVCGCLIEPQPWPTTPSTPPPSQPPQSQAMDSERLDTLLRLLDEEAFPDRALRLLETVARDHRFQVDQARRVLEVFHFGSDRLRALAITLPQLVDRANAFELLTAFDFDMQRAEARGIIERAGGGR